MKAQDFIALIDIPAQQLQKAHGLYASVTIAQSCLETGYGQFIPTDEKTGQNSYNLFGVKGDGPAGHVTCKTWEVENGVRVTIDAEFRAYHNYLESLTDHAAVLAQDFYAPVRNAATPEEACEQLHACGYATDPKYPTALISIINTYDLKQYDVKQEPVFLLSKEDQEYIVTRWISNNFELASDTDKEERHRLANELRIASGQPTT